MIEFIRDNTSELRRITLSLCITFVFGLLTYDYWAAHGLGDAMLVFVAGCGFLALLVSLPIIARSFSSLSANKQ